MGNVRVIARLDVKGADLIKGVHLEGLRKLGNPQDFASKYYSDGADELLYIDAVASLYGRNNLSEIVSRTADSVFIPMTVGGGIRSSSDVKHLLRCGADKVAINTAAVKCPDLLKDISQTFGSQCLVLSVQAKKVSESNWEVLTDNGRERTGLDVNSWIEQAVLLGVGEVLITSVDNEGTRVGYDVELIRSVNSNIDVPVIASGGFGKLQHIKSVVCEGHADAVAIADALHYNRFEMAEIRSYMEDEQIPVREYL